MSLWFFIWLIATLVMMYFVGWTLLIIYNQRKTWKEFSKKHGLRYATPTLTSSPELEGVYKNYTVSLFTSLHQTNTRRGSRRLTAIECTLKSDPIFDAGIANGDMRDFLINTLRMTNEVPIFAEGWTSDFVAVSPNAKPFSKYVTDERINGVVSLGKIKNAWVSVVFYNNLSLLRLDLPDALSTEKKMSVLLNRIVKVAQSLEFTDEEIVQFKSMSDQIPEPKTLPSEDQTDT